MRLGAQRFDYWVHRFGFGAPTGVDLPGEQQGIVLHSWQYSGSSMANLPFGQGESVTPMQMATAYSAIANGGILRAAAHRRGDRRQADARSRAGSGSSRPTTAAELRDMLRGVFADGGTASGAAIPGYDMAGKTGTANIVVNGQYSDSAYVASFIGMVPDQPPAAAGRGRGRPAAGLDLRRLGRGAGVPEDRRLGGSVLRDLAALSRQRLAGGERSARVRLASPASACASERRAARPTGRRRRPSTRPRPTAAPA